MNYNDYIVYGVYCIVYTVYYIVYTCITIYSAAKYLDPPSYKLEKEDSDDTKELKFKNWCNLALSGQKIKIY